MQLLQCQHDSSVQYLQCQHDSHKVCDGLAEMITINGCGMVQCLQCQHDSHTVCVALAEMIIINGRGIVQYNFEATVDEELTVDRGEQVMRVHDVCVFMYIYIYVYMYVYMCIYICASYTSIYICIGFKYVYVLYIYTYIYGYGYVYVLYKVYAGKLACVSKRKYIACIIVHNTNVQADFICTHLITSGTA